MDSINIKFVIPVIIEEVTAICLGSYDLDWKQLILIDNSKEGFCKRYEDLGAEVHYHPENLGVSKSWNIGMKSDFDYLWILSSSMVFKPGFSNLVEVTKNYANSYGVHTDQAWHCICLSKKTMKEVGLFDEFFYPGYFEDVDYAYRLKLKKIHDWGSFCLPKVEMDVQCQGIALALKANKVQVDFESLRKYYNEKWGGDPQQETFLEPFNGVKR